MKSMEPGCLLGLEMYNGRISLCTYLVPTWTPVLLISCAAQTTDTNVCKKKIGVGTGQYGLYHLGKNVLGIWDQPHTCYSWPVKSVLLNSVQNLREHQLSSICPVVTSWLAVK
jgi:hypothetical protein